MAPTVNGLRPLTRSIPAPDAAGRRTESLNGWRVAGATLAGERQMVAGAGSGGVDRIGGSGVERLLDRAVRIDPTLSQAWVALSELRLARDGLAAAVATLREGAKPISTSADRWWLLLRLAVRLLQSGDRAGFAETVDGIPSASGAGRVVGKLGTPTKSSRSSR